MTTLAEVTEFLITKPSIEEMDANPIAADYANELDVVATAVFNHSHLTNDQLLTAITLITTAALARMAESGDMDMKTILFLKARNFENLAAIVFKLSVGLSVLEELR